MSYKIKVDELPVNCKGCFASREVSDGRIICSALGYSVNPHGRDPACPWEEDDTDWWCECPSCHKNFHIGAAIEEAKRGRGF